MLNYKLFDIVKYMQTTGKAYYGVVLTEAYPIDYDGNFNNFIFWLNSSIEPDCTVCQNISEYRPTELEVVGNIKDGFAGLIEDLINAKI